MYLPFNLHLIWIIYDFDRKPNEAENKPNWWLELNWVDKKHINSRLLEWIKYDKIRLYILQWRWEEPGILWKPNHWKNQAWMNNLKKPLPCFHSLSLWEMLLICHNIVENMVDDSKNWFHFKIQSDNKIIQTCSRIMFDVAEQFTWTPMA